MTITLESSATGSAGGSGTSLTITKPSGTVSGDVLVAFLKCSDETADIIGESGWTEVAQISATLNITAACFYIVAGGSEPSDYTFDYDKSVAARRGWIGRFSGVDNSTPSDATPSTNSFRSTADLTADAITTGNANAYLIEHVNYDQPRTQDASDITELYESQHAVNGEIQSGTGSSGDKDSTLSSASANSTTLLWALKEAASGVTVAPAAVTAVAASTGPTVVLGSLSITPVARTGVVTSTGPTVVLGSLTIAPAAGTGVVVSIDPTVVIGGGVIVTPTAITAIAANAGPTVILGSLSLSPSESTAVAGSAAPSVIAGSLSLSPAAGTAVAGQAGPTTALGSTTATPSPATVVATTIAGTVIEGTPVRYDVTIEDSAIWSATLEDSEIWTVSLLDEQYDDAI